MTPRDTSYGGSKPSGRARPCRRCMEWRGPGCGGESGAVPGAVERVAGLQGRWGERSNGRPTAPAEAGLESHLTLHTTSERPIGDCTSSDFGWLGGCYIKRGSVHVAKDWRRSHNFSTYPIIPLLYSRISSPTGIPISCLSFELVGFLDRGIDDFTRMSSAEPRGISTAASVVGVDRGPRGI